MPKNVENTRLFQYRAQEAARATGVRGMFELYDKEL